MDKFISKTQMQTILDSRPKGVSMDDVIKGYRSNGYKVEGIDQPDQKKTEDPSLATKLGGRVKDLANAAATFGTLGANTVDPTVFVTGNNPAEKNVAHAFRSEPVA